MISKKIKRKVKRGLAKLGLIEKSSPENSRPAKSRKATLSEKIYVPRWRYKNYLAVMQFGDERVFEHKRWFIEQRYLHTFGKFPDLDEPKLFNEKIHWLNLNYQDELITRCCDKYEMKNYVSEVLGKQYVIPTIKTYERANQINFEELPDQFLIKVNWGDGPAFSSVVKNKEKANEDAIKGKMSNAIQPWNNLYYSHFFWGYKNVPPKIYVEQFIDAGEAGLTDYKIHCFNGEPRFVLVCAERATGKIKKTFLDMDWNVLPCHRADGIVDPDVKKPDNFDEMVEVAKKLSAPFPFVRVDLYGVEDQIFVGELTFHPGCGFEGFLPSEWDRIVGDMLVLPEKRIIE